MRELIRPGLFWVARGGLLFAVVAWIVGQWWDVEGLLHGLDHKVFIVRSGLAISNVWEEPGTGGGFGAGAGSVRGFQGFMGGDIGEQTEAGTQQEQSNGMSLKDFNTENKTGAWKSSWRSDEEGGGHLLESEHLSIVLLGGPAISSEEVIPMPVRDWRPDTDRGWVEIQESLASQCVNHDGIVVDGWDYWEENWKDLMLPGIATRQGGGNRLDGIHVRHWLVVTVFAVFYGVLKWVYRKRGREAVGDE